MQIKAVLFDMDGVLVNTEPLHYRMWKEAFYKRGLEIDYEKYKGCIGCTHDVLMDIILTNYGWDFRKDSEIKPEAFQIKRDIVSSEGYPAVDGASEMLAHIYEAGYTMAIASSSPPEFINMAMDSLKARQYFTLLNSGENVKHSKPEPDIYLDTARKLNVTPEECIVLEDSTNGCLAATRAGMLCVGFRNPDSGDQDLSLAKVIIDDIREFTAELIEELSK